MKYSALLLSAAAVSNAKVQTAYGAYEQLGMTPKDVPLFVAGLIQGLIDKDDLSEIQQCLNGATDIEQEVAEAIQLLQKGDVQSIIQAVEDIGKVIQDLPVDLENCKDMQGDIQRIENWAKIFSEPAQLALTLLANVTQHLSAITTDISNINTDFADAQYQKAGEDIADVLVQAVGKVPQEELGMNGPQVAQFVSGLIQGLVGKEDLPNIEDCMSGAKDIEAEINDAIANLKQKDVPSIVQAIMDIGQIIQELPKDLETCKGMDKDLKKIGKWASIFRNPVKLVWTLTTHVTSHLGNIIKDIGSITGDFASSNFKQAGMDVADILVQVLGQVHATELMLEGEIQPENLPITQW